MSSLDDMRLAIIGVGGFGRDVLVQVRDAKVRCSIDFYVDPEFAHPSASDLRHFDPSGQLALVAIADPFQRAALVARLPQETRFYTFIHPDARVLGKDVSIGEGSVVCPGCVLTTSISIGTHAHLNIGVSLGHDTKVGNFFTAAPGAKVSGNCKIGDLVYIGTNAAVRERIRICSEVTIGLMAGVVKDIEIPGTYVGVPARQVK